MNTQDEGNVNVQANDNDGIIHEEIIHVIGVLKKGHFNPITNKESHNE